MLDPKFLTLDAWEPAKHSIQGDPNESDIHLAVGRALTHWERLEMCLANLFATLVETNSHAANRAFGTIASTRGRIDALDEAAEVFFGTYPDDDHVNEYKLLIKLASKATARRNEIAHGVTEKHADYGFEGGGWYLVASAYNSRKNHVFIHFDTASGSPHTFTAAKYDLTATQIYDFTDGFHTLAQRVSNFSRHLRSARSSRGPGSA